MKIIFCQDRIIHLELSWRRLGLNQQLIDGHMFGLRQSKEDGLKIIFIHNFIEFRFTLATSSGSKILCPASEASNFCRAFKVIILFMEFCYRLRIRRTSSQFRGHIARLDVRESNAEFD